MDVNPERIFSQIIARDKHETDTYTVRIVVDSILSTDSSGKITSAFSQVDTSAPLWTDLAAAFDEYRTLAMRVVVKPYRFAGGSSVTTLAPIASVTDLDSSAILTSYALAGQYSSYKETQGGMTHTAYAAMSGPENSVFQSTASVGALWYLKLYSSGNTASTAVANVAIERIVQFRGKGI